MNEGESRSAPTVETPVPRAVGIGCLGTLGALVFAVAWLLAGMRIANRIYDVDPDSSLGDGWPDTVSYLVLGPPIVALQVAVPAFLLTFVFGLVVWAVRGRRAQES